MKNKIIIASKNLFLNYGFKSITMDDIAKHIGISKKTIYVHFTNKTKLVEAVAFTIFDEICCGIDAIRINPKDPIEELYAIKVFVLNYMKNEKLSSQFQLQKYYPRIAERLHLKQFNKMQICIKESLQKGIDTNLFRKQIDVDFISRMYFNGMTGLKNQDIFPVEQFTMDYLMENYLEYHLRAIVTDKGLQILNKHIISNQL